MCSSGLHGVVKIGDVGEDDVADGFIQAADAAEVVDVVEIARRLDGIPRHLLDDGVSDDLLRVRRRLAKRRVGGQQRLAKREFLHRLHAGEDEKAADHVQRHRHDQRQRHDQQVFVVHCGKESTRALGQVNTVTLVFWIA